jgi:hypothetical protein
MRKIWDASTTTTKGDRKSLPSPILINLLLLSYVLAIFLETFHFILKKKK